MKSEKLMVLLSSLLLLTLIGGLIEGAYAEPAQAPTATPTSALKPVTLQAEPAPLEIDLQRSAILVIDMQNAYLSKGGMVDLLGLWGPETRAIIEPNKKIISAARAKGVKVIYVLTVQPPDLRSSGGPDSPLWYKDMASKVARAHPEWRDKLTIRGTWGADVVKELKPQEGDLIFEKMRFSAFFQTNLDTILKTWGIKYLIFTGTATNVCVEASIRDAYYHFYFPILVSDATYHGGPPGNQTATIWVVKVVYGWVTNTENVIKALQ